MNDMHSSKALADQEDRSRSGEVWATMALTAMTVVVAVGMGRLFEDDSFLLPVTVAALVSHTMSWVGRRAGLPLWLVAMATLGAVALTATWLVLPHTTALGIPWITTVEAARHELSRAAELFAEVVAPAPVAKGFLIAAMAGVATMAFLADWAAFRVRARWEAAVPSFALMLFTSVLGAGTHRALHVGAYLLSLVAFVLVQEATLSSARSSWFASHTRAQGHTREWWQTGATLGSMAIVVGLVVGPLLPAGDGRSGGKGGGGRRVLSPLVDIRGRLVDRSLSDVFSVRSDRSAYWRLTSLDTFDGNVWSSKSDYRPVRERLPSGPGIRPLRRNPAERGQGERVVQEFRIESLSSIWLPAAYRPVRVEGVEGPQYEEQLGSLVTGRSSTDGLAYKVESVIPTLTAQDLSRSPAGTTDAARFLALPPVSDRVRALAEEIAFDAGASPAGAGATTFDKALALQNFFQRGFAYDLQTRAGHDEDALEQFLFRTKRGYCEQFAGAYAVMARLLGIPSRVAVGFTPGELGPDGRYHVRALNAHAWPEVLLDGFGWIAFEPTPGRGAPGARHTGLPEAQARPDDLTTATTAQEAPQPAQPSTVPPPAEDGPPPQPQSTNADGPPYLSFVAPLALGALIGAIPLAKRLRRARRRALSASPEARVMVAWLEAVEALAAAGVTRRVSETLTEYAPRAASHTALGPEACSALTTVASAATAANYSTGSLPEQVVNDAIAASAAVTVALSSSASTGRRIWRALDPRPLVRPGGT